MITRKLGVAAAAILMSTFAGGCGSDGDSQTVKDFATILQAGAKESGEEVTSEQANCLAKVYVDMIGEDGVKKIIAAGEDGVDAAMDDAMEGVDMVKAAGSLEDLAKCMPEMFEDMEGGGSGDESGDAEEEPAEG